MTQSYQDFKEHPKFYRHKRRRSRFKPYYEEPQGKGLTQQLIGFYTDEEKRVRPLTKPNRQIRSLSLPKTEPLRGPKPRWLTQKEWKLIQQVEYVGDDRFPTYRTNYIGSKQKIVPIILEETPPDVETVFDAFGGSNVVAYNYKQRGYRVITNDRLKYSYHIARAIIENNHVRLSKKDVKMLLKPNHKRTFVYDNFRDTFFTPEICREIDSIRNNINNLKGYKRSIALASLGKTCLDTQHFSQFTFTKKSEWGRQYRLRSAEAFRKRFIENVNFYNRLVFDNGKSNKALCMDVNFALRKVDADLVYFDPPYVTEYTSKSYEDAYHFVEGLMTHWRGKSIDHRTKTKMYKEREKPLTKETVYPFFEGFIKNSRHIDHVMISYRNKAYPRGVEIKRMLEKHGKKIRKCRWIRHQYQISPKHKASRAIEYLFIAD